MKWEEDNLDAILETWFGGTMHGAAVADVLFGEANPSGRLTMSFPVNEGEIPIYFSAKSTGRPLMPMKSIGADISMSRMLRFIPLGLGLATRISRTVTYRLVQR